MIMEIHSCGVTDIGCRRPSNEDQYLLSGLGRTVVADNAAQQDSHTLTTNEVALLAVADGVGGHSGGAIASKIAVESIGYFAHQHELELRHSNELWRMANLVRNSVLYADEQIRQLSQTHPTRNNMATTLTVALVKYPDLIVCHAGDSSCYVGRNNQMTKLTNDHTVAEAYRMHAGANQRRQPNPAFKHMLWNCLGGQNRKLEVETHTLKLDVGGWVILATDGLTSLVSEQEMQQQRSSAKSAREFCHHVRKLAIERGGNDNVTVVACNWNKNGALVDAQHASERTINWINTTTIGNRETTVGMDTIQN